MTTDFAGRHTMDSPDWYTPSCFVESSRKVMGSIDVDPASDAEANQIVKAERFYDIQSNGLVQPWVGNVLLNPPGGSDDDGNGLVPQFWLKLMGEYWISRHCTQAVWVGYSLEQLQTLQGIGADYTPLDFTVCYLKKRIAFIENAAKKAARIQKLLAKGDAPDASARSRKIAADIRAGKEPPNSPSHGNYIAYIGSSIGAFNFEFSQYGQVVVRC